MESKLQLAMTRDFNGITLNCYREDEQEDPQDFWATREQIGQALGYKRPRHAIANIHDRYKKRLGKFSRVLNLSTPSGMQATTVYNFKGLLEICRYSQQPNAHKVIDVLWYIADEIRRTGMYVSPQVVRRLEERVSELEKRLDADQAFTNLGHVVLALPGSITFQTASQFLSQHGISTGQNRLFKYCRDKKLICSRKGKQRNRPTQKSLEQGLFSVELSGGFNAITMITPRGLSRLVEMLSQEQYPLCLMMECPEDD